MSRSRRFAALLLILFTLTGAGWWYGVHWRPDPDRYPVQGIDVSAATGEIDWPMLKARGADFAYIVATRGAAKRDVRFEANWKAAAEAGMRRGAVHVYSLCASARRQAANFVRTVPRNADALPSALRLRFDPACSRRPERDDLIRQLALFLTLTERHMGKPMLIDISDDFESRYAVTKSLPRTVWAERFFFTPGYAAKPWAVWRATRFLRVDGADEPVHWNVVTP
ncbi:GH25 family lysozyme [Stakelama saccharophila]|uniref:GH25 family lysozyme n=1 Tax=Stakelama saccharophila TaxID=3075605 RepID=A0ABZ0B6T4_9SPHN|nr:GH25 family lysozyme [Stakelama sp. W311]WNO52952.1 GH25 family lysozyme [Stakelama sp. W311]